MIDLRFRPLDKPIAVPQIGFRKSPYSIQWGRLLDELESELKALKAENIVVEGGFTGDQIRNDGWPAGGAVPSTPGIRLSFHSRRLNAPLSYECNKFADWKGNLRAIGLTLQRLRLIDELGTSPRGEQYRGWAALPPADSSEEWSSTIDAIKWLHSVAGLEFGTCKDVDDLYRAAAKKAHPDTGGSNELMSKVVRAKDFIEKYRGTLAAGHA